jgi:hypothetical protein
LLSIDTPSEIEPEYLNCVEHEFNALESENAENSPLDKSPELVRQSHDLSDQEFGAQGKQPCYFLV